MEKFVKFEFSIYGVFNIPAKEQCRRQLLSLLLQWDNCVAYHYIYRLTLKTDVLNALCFMIVGTICKLISASACSATVS